MATWITKLFRWILPEDPSYRRYSSGRPALVVPFRGFVSQGRAYLHGRVLRDRRIQVSPGDSLWRNLANNYKRFGSLTIPNALIHIKIGENKLHLVSDNYGYFHYDGPLQYPLEPGNDAWTDFSLHLLGTLGEIFDYQCSGEVLAPCNARFGIVSDVDDTIIKSGITSLLKLKAVYLTLVKNAFGRQAFQSVADFYQALQKGPDGTCDNPVFYVSNGPWNLYDLLCDFFQLHELPKGPVFMRDFGFLGRRLWGKPSTHKADHIRRIITAYPDLPFVLIGDSGERDTDIYMEIARSFPGRILAIFIRDVEIPGRTLRISRLIESARGEIVMHIIKNYREAALFARQLGLIEPLGGEKEE